MHEIISESLSLLPGIAQKNVVDGVETVLKIVVCFWESSFLGTRKSCIIAPFSFDCLIDPKCFSTTEKTSLGSRSPTTIKTARSGEYIFL